jgi:hypothetical protein
MTTDETTNHLTRGGTTSPAPDNSSQDQRYVGWFHELDAWTEYWDIYHPETCGRYYFGDGRTEAGLLTRFLPRTEYPPAFIAWTRMALLSGARENFLTEVRVPEVASAVMELDALVARLFSQHFGAAANADIKADYLEAIYRFAIDSLPPATERFARIPDDDWRKPTAGRHALDSDLMWFAWALQLEAADAIAGRDVGHARRSLLLAGVASGCPANFARRGHRRTRSEYKPNDETARLLRQRGLSWVNNFDAGAAEVHALYRIREWGEDAVTGA